MSRSHDTVKFYNLAAFGTTIAGARFVFFFIHILCQASFALCPLYAPEGNNQSTEEAETAAAAAVVLTQAHEAAIPRLSMLKAHAGKVVATRQIGEGGAVVTLGATDRWVGGGWCQDSD